MKFLINFLQLLSIKDKINFYFLIAASTINVFLELLSIGMVIPLIGILLNPDKVLSELNNYFPDLKIFNDFLNLELSSYLLYFLVIFFSIFLLKNIFIFFYFYYQNKFVQKIEADLAKRLLEKFFSQNYTFFVNKNSSSLITKLTADLVTFTRGFVGPLITLISEVMIIIGFCLIIIFFKLTDIGFIFLFFFCITAFFLKIIGGFSKKWGKSRSIFDNDKIDILKTTFLNIKSIILDNKYSNRLSDFIFTTQKLANLHRKIITISIVPKVSFELIGIFSIVVVLYYLVINDFSNEQIITTTGFFIAVAYRVIPSFQRIIFCYQQISFGKTVLKKIQEDLRLNNQVSYTEKKIGFKDNIELKNVNFSHTNRSQKIFENANIQIKRGEIVGIFGESGVGKSTLVDIICGLIIPQSGSLFIDNLKINSLDYLREWQNEIAYVTQNTVLFRGSLKDNITFSNSEERLNKKLLEKVVKQSKLEKFINELPNGYETDVGEFGVKVSGGQKQRIGIARALYKQPKFLIFDEATNALDLNSEDYIFETIFKLKDEFTILIISHKKSLIERCDKIFKIQNSKVNLVSKF